MNQKGKTQETLFKIQNKAAFLYLLYRGWEPIHGFYHCDWWFGNN